MKVKVINARALKSSGKLESAEMVIEDGVIQEIGQELTSATFDIVWDAEGLFISPGFVDVHVHLREPGGEAKETIATGTQAAAKGGFTTICAMPNTTPVPDDVQKLDDLKRRIKETARVRVLPYASITSRQAGRELVDMKVLAGNGAFAFTDDGVGIQNAGMMQEAMKEASSAGKAVVAHCEDNSLVHKGVCHQGEVSQRLALPGIASTTESVQIARDVLLAEQTGCHYHVCHVSTKESVRIIRNAKKAGIHVTAEVTPHHLLLHEDDITEDHGFYKMNPPLRSREDQKALLEALKDGTIDFIATDHAPHTEEEKQQGFLNAPFGITGLETAFPLLYTHLVEKGFCTLKELVDWMTVKPAAVFNLPYGTLIPGAPADFTMVDLESERTLDRKTFLSKGKNTPFDGWTLKGWPVRTIVNGNLAWEEPTHEAART
ncbi:dihydroorotase [Halobacillus litoralis]|uniref:Dihydroorotase n=1 Tax=Halobacillus litoralis TaxID=45668 RepID=A0A845E077_9BACI|nr:dihydroorotase [Halobacillus litoralis]MYL19114.1 dihydroorotase [Halobacillus litoralis]